jgi:hypothetical protein
MLQQYSMAIYAFSVDTMAIHELMIFTPIISMKNGGVQYCLLQHLEIHQVQEIDMWQSRTITTFTSLVDLMERHVSMISFLLTFRP